MIILGSSQRSGHTPVVLRVVILATLLQEIGFAQPPPVVTCTLSNGIATGFFGGVNVSGTFTDSTTASSSNITVSGAYFGGNYSYTFTGPLDGGDYTQTSKIPPALCVVEFCTPGPGKSGYATLHVYPNDYYTAASLGFEDTGELFSGYGNLSCSANGTPPPAPPAASCSVNAPSSTLFKNFPNGYVTCPASNCKNTPSTPVPGDLTSACLIDETPLDSRNIKFQLWCGDYLQDNLINPPRPINCPHCYGLYEFNTNPAPFRLVGKCWFDKALNQIQVNYDASQGEPPGAQSCWTSSSMKNFETVPLTSGHPWLPNDPRTTSLPQSGSGWDPAAAPYPFYTWWYFFHVDTQKLDISVFSDQEGRKQSAGGLTKLTGQLNNRVYILDPPPGPNFNDLVPTLFDLPSDTDPKDVSPTSLACDLNGDGKCDDADVAIFEAALGSCVGDPAYTAFADPSGHGCVDAFDQRLLFPADLNMDGKVDCADLAIVTAAFGTTYGQTGFDPRADVIVDGVINIRDLAFVSQYLPKGMACQN